VYKLTLNEYSYTVVAHSKSKTQAVIISDEVTFRKRQQLISSVTTLMLNCQCTEKSEAGIVVLGCVFLLKLMHQNVVFALSRHNSIALI